MTDLELKEKVRELADACNESRNQRAVKGVLCGLLGAMYSGREEALLLHWSQFGEREIKRLTASRN